MNLSETIDVGIDLGTTHSLVSVMTSKGPFLIPNEEEKVLTPSCVGIDENGQFIVGAKAYNGAREFKRIMGTTVPHPLTQLTAEQMSSLVLKSLKADVQKHFQFDPDAAVITVPAIFEASQLEATHRAAQSAGFQQIVLLQEPIAAALAAGISPKESGYFLVYDFGGGTFDVSILSSSKTGIFRVVDHDGDNFLGGRDCDLKLVDWMATQLEPLFPQFRRENPKYRFDFDYLKTIATQVKMALSTQNQVEIQLQRLPSFPDFSGKTLSISVEQFELLIESEVEKTIQFCQTVLKRNQLHAKDLHSIILVGGGTLMPIVPKKLRDVFQVPLNQEKDPMQIVAQGACIFAASEKRQKIEHSQEWFQLEYERLTQAETVLCVGKSQKNVTNPTYQIVHETSKHTEKLVLDEKQRFVKRLSLTNEGENRFVLRIFENETEVATQSLSIFRGQKISAPPLSRTLGVWLANNAVAVYLEKGTPLPARKTKTHLTSRMIFPEDIHAVFEVKVVQGENNRADRNRLVGKIEVPGLRLKKSIPQNSEVLVTLSVDRSGVVKAKAYIPYLEQEFESVITLAMNVPETKDLEDEYFAQKARLEELSYLLKRKYKELEILSQNIEKEIRFTKSGDLDAGLKAKRMLLDLAIQLDLLREEAEWPLLQEEFQEIAQETQKALQEYGKESEREYFQLLVQEIEQAFIRKELESIQQKLDGLARLKWATLSRSPRFWEQSFRDILAHPEWLTDRKKGTQLLDQGSHYLRNNQSTELIEVTKKLWLLIPSEKRIVSDLR